jgi:hypothetical protein
MAGTGTLGQAARQAGDQVLYPVSAGYSTIATLTMIDRLYGPTKHLGNRGGCQNLSYPGSNAGWLSDLLSMPVSGQLLAGRSGRMTTHLDLSWLLAAISYGTDRPFGQWMCRAVARR